MKNNNNSETSCNQENKYLTSDRYFKYEDIDGKKTRFKIFSYRFYGKECRNKDSFSEIFIKIGYVRTIGCLCGSNDWNDNGRFINEYECNGCGGFIEVIADDE